MALIGFMVNQKSLWKISYNGVTYEMFSSI